MKKFLLSLAVLFGLATVFTGCTPSVVTVQYGNYSVGLKNTSSSTVQDWYVYDVNSESIWTFTTRPDLAVVPSGSTHTMTGITGGRTYIVRYKVSGKWYSSAAFFLNEDKLLTVYDTANMIDLCDDKIVNASEVSGDSVSAPSSIK